MDQPFTCYYTQSLGFLLQLDQMVQIGCANLREINGAALARS